MKINNKGNINFPDDNSAKNNIKKKRLNNEIKSTEASSVDALSSQGRALINMSFKGTLQENSSQLTDEEYEKLKAELTEKIKNLPSRLHDEERAFNGINRENILLVSRIFDEEALYKNEDFLAKAGRLVLFLKTPERIKLTEKIFSDKRLYENKGFMKDILKVVYNTDKPENCEVKLKLIDKILSDERLYNNQSFMNNAGEIIANAITDEHATAKIKVIDKILCDERLYKNESFVNNVMDNIGYLNTTKRADAIIGIIDKITTTETLFGNKKLIDKIGKIIIHTQNDEQMQAKTKFLDMVCADEKLIGDEIFVGSIGDILSNIEKDEDIERFKRIIDNEGLPVNQAAIIFTDDSHEFSTSDLKKINRIIGLDITSKMHRTDTLIASKFVDVLSKRTIEEIPKSARKKFLRNLVVVNSELFEISETLSNAFPILPKTQEEYCKMLPLVVRSIGIETNPLNSDEIEALDKNITELSETLSEMNDNDFNNLRINQDYDKDSFIKDILAEIKNCSEEDKQKIFDRFGFELHRNRNSKRGYTIIGYPNNNINKENNSSDKDIADICENIDKYIDKFNNNNHINCNNKEIEVFLNDIIKSLPELRTTIGKVQAGNINEYGVQVGRGSHNFDIFKHSLKVMQKIVQDSKYNELDKSDKRIMLLGALFHDITKREGYTDSTHPTYGSFDSYFITNKLNLTDNEKIKLYTLIKNHEWLAHVNRAKNEEDLEKKIQSAAYDLRHDNIFDMELIFTHADLKAVKNNDSFHSVTEGRARTDFTGNKRSFGESADLYAEKIKKYIEDLKSSQPLLPVTKIPKAYVIEKAITEVKDDGSTNIKGIYKNKQGLIIIKFNEVDDWEKIGFKKGSSSKGITSTTSGGEKVDTGNIKFFVHGLEFANHVAKFDAFSQIDSDALLSVSYAERPESKYRFFRPQGIVLDCDTKFVHGGGNNDEGSGFGKTIQDFKDSYIFGAKRESDRKYISDLIKNATGMTNEEYINFVKDNENKALSEIEPKEIRNKIINAFASINSNSRKGNRSYNEMYISNPKPPMAVFAYNVNYDEEINNPVEFLNRKKIRGLEITYDTKGGLSVYERTKFLQDYAKEHDIPFIIFGK